MLEGGIETPKKYDVCKEMQNPIAQIRPETREPPSALTSLALWVLGVNFECLSRETRPRTCDFEKYVPWTCWVQIQLVLSKLNKCGFR